MLPLCMVQNILNANEYPKLNNWSDVIIQL